MINVNLKFLTAVSLFCDIFLIQQLDKKSARDFAVCLCNDPPISQKTTRLNICKSFGGVVSGELQV
jgi:hypothetical protein